MFFLFNIFFLLYVWMNENYKHLFFLTKLVYILLTSFASTDLSHEQTIQEINPCHENTMPKKFTLCATYHMFNGKERIQVSLLPCLTLKL
jgi:hypothetical protein